MAETQQIKDYLFSPREYINKFGTKEQKAQVEKIQSNSSKLIQSTRLLEICQDITVNNPPLNEVVVIIIPVEKFIKN